MARLLRFPQVLLALALLAASGGLARAQVTPTLESETSVVVPGHPFWIALKLVHAPGWHSYWMNPGTGLPTKVVWKLPPGFTAGEPQWPTPSLIHDETGAISGMGYEGTEVIPIRITPPADLKPGTHVAFEANVSWLMCQQSCVPGKSVLSLWLTAGKDESWNPAVRTEIEAARARLPHSIPGWRVSLQKSPKAFELTLAPDPASAPARTPAASELRFFPESDAVAFDQPQTVDALKGGAFRISIPIVTDPGTVAPARLVGVLRADKGWDAEGRFLGMAVNLAPGEGPPPPARSAAQGAVRSLLATLGLAFIGGLILNLMPCVFPVLGIKVLGFVQQAGAERRKVVLHGVVFSAGVLLSFWTLAGLLAVLRAGGSELGWGFQLQSPAFVFVLAIVMLVFGLSMSGVFEFGLSATSVGSGLQTKSGLTGSFFTGILATLVATPCSAPFLAPALGAALALSTAQSFAVFTAIAVGLSTPYLLLSIFPGAVSVLPRPGAWMETFKQVMAFPLYGTVGFLLWVLAGQVGDTALLNLIFGIVLIAMGAWIYGHWCTTARKPGVRRAGGLAAVAVLALGVWAGWPAAPAPGGITWEPWSAARVAELRAEGRPVYIDFTARWCATCQANKRIVFGSADVLRAFREKKIVTLRADWTNRDPAITAELARWNRSAVPFDLIYLPGKPKPVELPELLTPEIVLNAIK
ncbi:thiol:disulfide interchange protein DsbD precursor [mine drainage metagenome]|uniref:Thiol:disulfide interchange protein DsbD n=1 Tax=mine drainage metagenome TaxID=410659 RepID=A0A1J5SBQ1_9ZZZZ